MFDPDKLDIQQILDNPELKKGANEFLFERVALELDQIFNMVCQFNNVGAEKDLIKTIISDMKNSNTSPEDALSKARKILNDLNSSVT